jgi:hypothetical protein
MPAVADAPDFAAQLNAAATHPSLDPAECVADVRRVRFKIESARDGGGMRLADARDLLGQADMYVGDLELQREAGAMGQQLARAQVREDADIRDALVAQGIASSDELDAAGWPSHDALASDEADGTLMEAIAGMLPHGAAAYKELLHPRDRKGEWRDKPGVVKPHARGGGAVPAAAKPANYPRWSGLAPSAQTLRPAAGAPPHPRDVPAGAQHTPMRGGKPAVMAVAERWPHLEELNKAAQDAKAGDHTAVGRIGVARAKIEGSLAHAEPHHHDAIMHHTYAASVGALPPEPVDTGVTDHRAETDRHLAHMFNPDETEKAKQSFGSAEALFAQAEADHPEFESILTGGLAEELGARVPATFEEAVANATDHPDEPQVVMGPMKKMERAKQKVDTKYDGDWDRLQDVLRATVVVPTLDHMPAAVEAIRKRAKAAGWSVRKAENRYADDDQDHNVGPTPQGYRDAAVALVSPAGIVSELQINTAPMFEAKQGEGHHMYEESRSIEADIKTRMATAPSASQMSSPGGPTADELARLEHLERESKALYGRALEASYG